MNKQIIGELFILNQLQNDPIKVRKNNENSTDQVRANNIELALDRLWQLVGRLLAKKRRPASSLN